MVLKYYLYQCPDCRFTIIAQPRWQMPMCDFCFEEHMEVIDMIRIREALPDDVSAGIDERKEPIG